MSRIALVTGANKGIGYHIARNLACSGFNIFIGCRDIERGSVAQKELQAEAPNATISLIEIDISKEETVKVAAAKISVSCEEGLDVLVNNAAMAHNVYSTVPFAEQATQTIDVNYFGTLKVCEHFIPLLKKSGNSRVINISSRMGSSHKVKDILLRDEITSPTLTVQRLNEIMNGFRKHAISGTHLASGWPNSAYSVSKIGVTALTRVLARDHPDIKVFSCCPGWCKTDMAGWENAPKSAEQGADTPSWLAVDGDAVSGKMYAERHLMNI